MSFLPASYEPPTTGNYAKLQNGENRFRILGPAIIGNLFWQTDAAGKRKPIRRRDGVAIAPHELGTDAKGQPERAKHFWAMPVWNRTAKQVQILEVTQSTLQSGIYALCQSQDWGAPTGYDIIIHKSGTGMDTEYKVLPGRAAPTEADILAEYRAMNINMDALYDGGDPLASGGSKPADPPKAPPTMTFDQAIASAAAVGVTRDDVVAHLKAKGLAGWNAVVCTPIVQDLIASKNAGGPGDDEIPF